MRSEQLDWFRDNWFVLLGLILSFETAFFFGYLVLSDFPFRQFADFTLISWITSQTMLFILFLVPGLLFNFRLNLVEGMIPLRRLVEPERSGLLLFYFMVFFLVLLIFVRDLRPGLVGFVAANALVFWLYHPSENYSVGSTKYRKVLWLLRSSPKRTWRLAIRPYWVLMFRNCAWLFGMILFAWIGFLRFSYLANDNIQLLNVEGLKVETAVVGRNSIGLIVRNSGGDYSVYPLGSISSITLPEQ